MYFKDTTEQEKISKKSKLCF